MEYDKLLKILIIGESTVGKTCLLNRFADSYYNESTTSTIGIDFKLSTLNIDSKRVKMQMWDSTGQAKFRSITNAYYPGTHVIFACYDMTNFQTFKILPTFIEQVQTAFAQKHINEENGEEEPPFTPTLMIIGTKCDLESKRQVTQEQVKQVAQQFNICDSMCLETSSKCNINVNEMFDLAVRDALLRHTQYLIAQEEKLAEAQRKAQLAQDAEANTSMMSKLFQKTKSSTSWIYSTLQLYCTMCRNTKQVQDQVLEDDDENSINQQLLVGKPSTANGLFSVTN